MNNSKIKKIIDFLFVFGIGFATSCFIGLDGFRDQIHLNQLILGGILCGLSFILYLLFWRCPNCGKLLSPFSTNSKKHIKCKKCKK